jgi:glutathione S-transferase
MTQADLAVVCCLRHLGESQPGMVDAQRYPGLARHCAHYEALPLFQKISQAFIAPA